MKPRFDFRGLWACWVLACAMGAPATAQVTITASDMFNQVGQYYLAYANNPTNTVTVTGMLGAAGGPQAWDFSTGPTDVTNRFDYIAATNALFGADFSALGATLAEQKTDLSGVTPESWLFFTQDPVRGRLDFGFEDPNFSATQPESIFTDILQDFPATIHYGDSWQGATTFNSIYSLPDGGGDYPDQLGYTSTDKVDAYGVVILPGSVFLDCLRVHEVVTYAVSVDFGDGGGFRGIGSQSLLNYYWLCPGHGIAVQVTSTSPSDGTVPPDDLPGGAAALVRQFSTNHAPPSSTNSVQTIKNFTCTLGSVGALLKWTLQPALKNYTVEYATNLTANPKWTTLQTVTNNFVLDLGAGKKGSPTRLYRVLGN